MPTDGTDERPLGRPTKFNDETIGRLCTALSDGMPIKGACVVAGIGVTTLAEWRASQPDLEVRMSEARERARQKALQAIKEAGEGLTCARRMAATFIPRRLSRQRKQDRGQCDRERIFIRRHGRKAAGTARTSSCCFGIASYSRRILTLLRPHLP